MEENRNICEACHVGEMRYVSPWSSDQVYYYKCTFCGNVVKREFTAEEARRRRADLESKWLSSALKKMQEREDFNRRLEDWSM